MLVACTHALESSKNVLEFDSSLFLPEPFDDLTCSLYFVDRVLPRSDIPMFDTIQDCDMLLYALKTAPIPGVTYTPRESQIRWSCGCEK